MDNKVVAIDLDGAENENNIIRGNLLVRNNYGVDVDASNLNLFQDNILYENGMGFSLNSCGKNTLLGNSIQNGSYGIFLVSSSENKLQGTLLSNLSICGMYLYDSCKNTLDSNAMMNCSIKVQGSDVTQYQNDADTTNTINGKPLYYLCSQRLVTIPRDAGEVILVDSKECTIKDLRLDHGTVRLLLAYSTNNTVQGNIIRNQIICGLDGLSGCNDDNLIQGNLIERNADGIIFSSSQGNLIRKNTIRSNGGGLSLDHTVKTFVFRNTFSQNNNGIVVSQANESRFLFNNIYQNYAYGLIKRKILHIVANSGSPEMYTIPNI